MASFPARSVVHLDALLGVIPDFETIVIECVDRCAVCGEPRVSYGFMLPLEEPERMALLLMRGIPLTPNSIGPILVYGMCEAHAIDMLGTIEAIEAVLGGFTAAGPMQ